MQFHILSFEGPDAYSRVGGLATRVEGLSEILAALGYETHLWFVGSPELAGHEKKGTLHIHRWCQWLSESYPAGVYVGELEKSAEYASSLPLFLVNKVMRPYLAKGGRAVVLAEEWQTAGAVLNLHWLLRYQGLRDQVSLLWNANNTFGFERIEWNQLSAAAQITTVSRYMKHVMNEQGADSYVIPNGLPKDSFDPPDRAEVSALRACFRDRTVLTKMARWDPDKRWIESIGIVSELKRQNWRPLLVARGGTEAHGEEVLRAAAAHGLRIAERSWSESGALGLRDVLKEVDNVDVVSLRSHVDPAAKKALFRATDAVLANSGHEPFGLVGLETMAAGGIACTGCSGEDYAMPGQNALVLQTGEPREFIGLFKRLQSNPSAISQLRRAGRSTARHYAWEEVVERALLPRIEMSRLGIS
jgi:glycosyltransferase involved in cell wall biosynthesis